MKRTLFSYTYPEELVAQEPLNKRAASRMMVLDRKNRHWEHTSFLNLPSFLRKGDLLLLNNSRVFPARLIGLDKEGRKTELFLTEAYKGGLTPCIGKPMKRLQTGEEIFFESDFKGVIKSRLGETLYVDFLGESIAEKIEEKGLPPLPPYIKRDSKKSYEKDKTRYQTIYAEKKGSAAAPTAGLHFAPELFEKMRTKGINIDFVTLHVSRDTFQPVRVDEIEDHSMHGELAYISEKTAAAINQTKKEGGRIFAVGTTTVRTLESAWKNGEVKAGPQKTELFIYPGFTFRVVDTILTNFHQPESTLLMMISAFAEREFVLKAYQEAIEKKYRLFSYGDCMLIL